MQGWPQKHYHPFCGHGFFGGRALLLDVLKIDLCLVFHVVHWHAIKDRGWWIDCGENRKEIITLVFVGEKVVMCLEKCCLVSTYSSPAIGTSLQSHLFVCTKAYPWLGGVPTLQTDVPPGQWRSPRLLGRLVLRWWWADGGTWCTCRRIASGFAKAVGGGERKLSTMHLSDAIFILVRCTISSLWICHRSLVHRFNENQICWKNGANLIVYTIDVLGKGDTDRWSLWLDPFSPSILFLTFPVHFWETIGGMYFVGIHKWINEAQFAFVIEDVGMNSKMNFFWVSLGVSSIPRNEVLKHLKKNISFQSINQWGK